MSNRQSVLLKLIGDIDRILDQPEHWCRKAFAKNAEGLPVKPESPEAVEFCLTGAIERACWVSGNNQFEPAMKSYFNKVCWPVDPAVVNDFGGTNFAFIKWTIDEVRKLIVEDAETAIAMA
jgi:hypothetical protein